MPQLCILKMPRYLTGHFRFLAIWGDCSGLLLRVIHKYRQCMKWNGLVNVWKANADEIKKFKYLHRMMPAAAAPAPIKASTARMQTTKYSMYFFASALEKGTLLFSHYKMKST